MVAFIQLSWMGEKSDCYHWFTRARQAG
jgi:hypothetical protein